MMCGCVFAASLPSSLLLRRQQRLIAGAHGVDEASLDILDGVNRDCFAIINSTPDNSEALRQMKVVYDKAKETAPEELARHLDFNDQVVETSLQTALSPWFRYFLSIDPIDSLKALPHQIPVLAINGSKDLQVPIECLGKLALRVCSICTCVDYPRCCTSSDIVDKALASAGHPRYTTRELKEHNHLFQQLRFVVTALQTQVLSLSTIELLLAHSSHHFLIVCLLLFVFAAECSSGQTGAPQEYSAIPETISPLAVHSITDWLKAEKLLN